MFTGIGLLSFSGAGISGCHQGLCLGMLPGLAATILAGGISRLAQIVSIDGGLSGGAVQPDIIVDGLDLFFGDLHILQISIITFLIQFFHGYATAAEGRRVAQFMLIALIPEPVTQHRHRHENSRSAPSVAVRLLHLLVYRVGLFPFGVLGDPVIETIAFDDGQQDKNAV